MTKTAITHRETGVEFTDVMVKAILANWKTQVRQVIRPQPVLIRDGLVPAGNLWSWNSPRTVVGWEVDSASDEQMRDPKGLAGYCPFGHAGNRLWVQEDFEHIGHGRIWGVRLRYSDQPSRENHIVIDPCPDREDYWRPVTGFKTTTAFEMPRWASRIDLEILKVRVERLQEISDFDCQEEGITPGLDDEGFWVPGAWKYDCSTPQLAFATYWDQTHPNPADQWAANPWVWVLDFNKLPVIPKMTVRDEEKMVRANG